MCVINDPLGQTQSPAGSDHYSHLKVESCFAKKYGRTDTTVEIVINTGRECGLASWINMSDPVFPLLIHQVEGFISC